MIKEIKTIYSGRIKSTNPIAVTPEINTLKTKASLGQKRQTFFNGVIDKLNIIVEDK